MSGGRVLIVAGLAVLVSGCAGRGTRQQLTRLQSQVGLLDDRVTQLERLGPSTPSLSTSETPSEGVTSVGEIGTSKHKSSAAIVVHSSKGSPSSSKPSTREIQQALKGAGFYQGSVDGKMGAMTRQAIEEFQRVNGLAPDGKVGKQTWAKLKQYAELSGSNANAAEVLK